MSQEEERSQLQCHVVDCTEKATHIEMEDGDPYTEWPICDTHQGTIGKQSWPL